MASIFAELEGPASTLRWQATPASRREAQLEGHSALINRLKFLYHRALTVHRSMNMTETFAIQVYETLCMSITTSSIVAFNGCPLEGQHIW